MKSFFLILATSIVCSSLAFAQVLTRQKVEEATAFCAKELMSDLLDQFESDIWHMRRAQSPSIQSERIVKSGTPYERIYVGNFNVIAASEWRERSDAFTLQMGSDIKISFWRGGCFSPEDLNEGSITLTAAAVIPAVIFRESDVKRKFDDFGRAVPHMDEIKSFEITGSDYDARIPLKNTETYGASKFSLDLAQYQDCLKTQLKSYIQETDSE